LVIYKKSVQEKAMEIYNYNKIKKILFLQHNSINFKKKAKKYANLAKISEFFYISKKVKKFIRNVK
jgi:hypothetical protein